MSGIHLLSRLEAFFNLTIKTARRIPVTETAARRFGIYPSSVGLLRSSIVRMSYICRRLGEEAQANNLFAFRLLQLKGVAAMEVHIAPLPNLGGLIIGRYPLPSFQRQETPRSGDSPRT